MTTPFPFVASQVLTAAQLNAITTLPINDQTASYVLVVGDVGKRVIMNNAGATTITVNNSVFTTGDTIFIANKGAGTSTVTAGAGVTINTSDSLALAQYQSGQLVALSASSFLFFPTTETAPASGVVQVKSTSKTDSFTLSFTTTFTDVTGLSVSITPTSASNKVLVIAQVTAGAAAGTNPNLRLMRDSTAISIGDTAGNRIRITTGDLINADYQVSSNSLVFLDSPATTSATTYKVQMCALTGQGATYVNRTNTDSDSASYVRGASSITVFEVAP